MGILRSAISMQVLLMLLVVAGCGDSGDTSTEPQGSSGLESAGAASDASVQVAQATQPKVDPDYPLVVLETSLGDITVKLSAQAAPLTVSNFLDYVDSDYYDDTVFHQVVSNYIVLGGGYSTTMEEKPAQMRIRNEAHNGLKNRRGTIAMARTMDVIDSSTSQFFINVADNPTLDHTSRDVEGYGYCVFGEVVDGMDIVDRIAQAETHDTPQFELLPVEPIVIRSAARTSSTTVLTATRPSRAKTR
jgi:cyclophilin family peptidyl-prolyl cis-trans isomerase